MVKLIQLVPDGHSVIDSDDCVLVEKYEWRLETPFNKRYARRRGKNEQFMHQLILPPKGGFVTDHIDGDGLNNRRSNLRYATWQQNSMNRMLARNTTSGYKGVTRRRNGYHAKIVLGGRSFYLGLYPSASKAALAYDAGAMELFGAFAYLNLPEEFDFHSFLAVMVRNKYIYRDFNRNVRSGLNHKDVKTIRRMRKSGWTLTAIAKKFDIGTSTVHGITSRLRYSDV